MTENKTIPGLPSEIKVKIIEELVQLTLDKFNSSFADIYFQESGSRIGTIADLKDIILSILVSINVNIIQVLDDLIKDESSNSNELDCPQFISNLFFHLHAALKLDTNVEYSQIFN